MPMRRLPQVAAKQKALPPVSNNRSARGPRQASVPGLLQNPRVTTRQPRGLHSEEQNILFHAHSVYGKKVTSIREVCHASVKKNFYAHRFFRKFRQTPCPVLTLRP
jgi:hypothetical protein